jgi:hypothetical protein
MTFSCPDDPTVKRRTARSRHPHGRDPAGDVSSDRTQFVPDDADVVVRARAYSR